MEESTGKEESMKRALRLPIMALEDTHIGIKGHHAGQEDEENQEAIRHLVKEIREGRNILEGQGKIKKIELLQNKTDDPLPYGEAGIDKLRQRSIPARLISEGNVPIRESKVRDKPKENQHDDHGQDAPGEEGPGNLVAPVNEKSAQSGINEDERQEKRQIHGGIQPIGEEMA
jgi:hypothetical protein